MDKDELTEKIRTANSKWFESVRTELHDVQYDYEADILYLSFGQHGDAFSIPVDVEGEEIYLRIEIDTYKFVGADIMGFRQTFLPNHPDAHDAFNPVFDFLGQLDWRIQLKPASKDSRQQLALFVPASAPLEYFATYIPKVAPELVPA